MRARILVDRTMAGITGARAQGKRLGRLAASDEIIARARPLRASGMSTERIAHELGIGKSVAKRVCHGVVALGPIAEWRLLVCPIEETDIKVCELSLLI
jgi:DNA invertase Pin-like site-specific DNA recombinase